MTIICCKGSSASCIIHRQIPTLRYRRKMVVFALTVVRHGETKHNKDNIIQGQLDVPLSSIGHQQAKLLGAHLRHQQYSHVYTSDLCRAKQTAESIVKQNLSYDGSMIHDFRLRERKFGVIEGKSVKYLKEAAGALKGTGLYTPPGGETVQQVRERAISFFEDLCQTIQEQVKNLLIKDTMPVSSQLNGFPYPNADSNNGCEHSIIGKKRKGENLSNYHMKKFDFQSSPINSNNEAVPNSTKCQQHNTSKKNIKHSPIKSHTEAMHNTHALNESEERGHLPDLLAENDIQSQLQGDSDNESSQRRPSACSSSDDMDGCIDVANVLVVSHGGLLRELLRHFIEDLGCPVPGGRHQALRLSPNTAVSKFTVSIEEHEQHPKIICHQIHDKQHLISISGKRSIEKNKHEIIAL